MWFQSQLCLVPGSRRILKRDGGSSAEKPSEPALPHTRELRVSLVAHRSISRRKKSPSKWNLRERSRFQECHPSVLPVDTIAGGDSQGRAYITNQSLSLNMGCALIQYTVWNTFWFGRRIFEMCFPLKLVVNVFVVLDRITWILYYINIITNDLARDVIMVCSPCLCVIWLRRFPLLNCLNSRCLQNCFSN